MCKAVAPTLLFFLVNKNKSVFSDCVHAAENPYCGPDNTTSVGDVASLW